ncbi:MAG: T9SS type A sorting domain-containing protein [Candidatus Cloacimonetes bacterium]|nr:T9SS type A sorting domain-containing protein [Candidatus Cloacimonadota bacterium]
MKVKIILIALILGIGFGLWGQDFYDTDTVNDIHLYFTQSNWRQILNQYYAAGQEQRLVGTAIINGTVYDSVGVRFKGHSSYNPNRIKNPFNIKLDHIIEDQSIGPYTTLKLANGFSDPSFIRDILSYEVAQKYMPACLANFARVYVNDVLIGVYNSIQAINSYFMRTHLHCSGEPRFKCGTNTFDPIPVWGYLGPNQSSYEQYYEMKSSSGWDELINFTNVMSNDPTNLAEVLNIDRNLWMIAFQNLLVNLDSPINVFHNFYLYGDAAGRFNPIIWDMNMSFGGFMGGSATLDPLRNSNSNTYLLISRMMSVPRYKKMYIAHMRTMMEENFANGWFATRGAELQAICAPYVQEDPNFLYTYNQFVSNLNNSVQGGGPGSPGSVPGIIPFMNSRVTFLQNHSAFQGTIPTITSIEHSPQELEQNGVVHFTLTAQDATSARLGLRQNLADKFDYYEMYDDGQHNDGAAGDGIFGVEVTIGAGDLQYYGWAENNSQGAFLPARAEHEFFESPVTSEEPFIYINEIQAKNTAYADPFGEFDDWVELYNPNDYPVDIAGMYMTDSHYSNGIDAWTQIPAGFPDETTIPAHGYLLVWFDEDMDQGPLHINDKLGGAADAVYLIASDGETVIDSKEWVASDGLDVNNVSLGRVPDGGPDWQLFGVGQPLPCTPGATNGGTANVLPQVRYVNYEPYPTLVDSPVTIGATITDSDGTVSLAELVWKMEQGQESRKVMQLSTSDIYTTQIGPFPEGTRIIYRVEATDNSGGVTASQTYGLTWAYEYPQLYINEFMASNSNTVTDEYGEYDDWAEIYNPNDFPVDLAGYYFTDDHYDFGEGTYIVNPIPHGYEAQTVIPAHGFKIIWFDDAPDQGPLHVINKLGSSADAIYMISPDMIHLTDQVTYQNIPGLATDLSWGRYPDGGDVWRLFGPDQDLPCTPGASNSGTAVDDELIPAANPDWLMYPNPMRASLTLEIKNTDEPAWVEVFNIKGQKVAEFKVDGKSTWNGTDDSGKALGNGIYLMRTVLQGETFTRRVGIFK